jgi:hypothetical protein
MSMATPPSAGDLQAAHELLSDLAAAGYVLAAGDHHIEVTRRLKGASTPPPLHPEIESEIARLSCPLRELLRARAKRRDA